MPYLTGLSGIKAFSYKLIGPIDMGLHPICFSCTFLFLKKITKT